MFIIGEAVVFESGSKSGKNSLCIYKINLMVPQIRSSLRFVPDETHIRIVYTICHFVKKSGDRPHGETAVTGPLRLRCCCLPDRDQVVRERRTLDEHQPCVVHRDLAGSIDQRVTDAFGSVRVPAGSGSMPGRRSGTAPRKVDSRPLFGALARPRSGLNGMAAWRPCAAKSGSNCAPVLLETSAQDSPERLNLPGQTRLSA